MSGAYYNELDPYAAQWLRNLIAAGHIAPGDVDERSIADVRPDDLRGYVQCHFFAGIGVWSYALRLAGFPDDRECWTGSCPCQPFSAAGKGAGFADERHLWPVWFRLIAECRPRVVFGEQVAGPAGERWLDLVHADLEGVGYAVGPVTLPAAGVGAPHGRHRIYFVADAECGTAERYRLDVGGAARGAEGAAQERQRVWADARHGGDARELADAECNAAEPWRLAIESREGDGASGAGPHAESGRCGHACELADTDRERCEGQRLHVLAGTSRPPVPETVGRGATDDVGDAANDGWRQERADAGGCGSRSVATRLEQRPECGGAVRGFWADADWLWCRDGAYRPVEPGTFPLAHGASARMGRLRAYGNAIVPQVAEAFIRTYLDVRGSLA